MEQSFQTRKSMSVITGPGGPRKLLTEPLEGPSDPFQAPSEPYLPAFAGDLTCFAGRYGPAAQGNCFAVEPCESVVLRDYVVVLKFWSQGFIP